jgi:hypothetical protein
MARLSPEFIAKWSHIINDVDKTDIPADLIESVDILLYNGSKHVIDVDSLQHRGLNYSEIEELLNDTLNDFKEEIESVDFFLNIQAVADTIQPVTDYILNKSGL